VEVSVTCGPMLYCVRTFDRFPRWMKTRTTRKVAGARSTDESVMTAVDRAFAVLGAFRPSDQSVSLAEIAARTGMYKSTILRVIRSLLKHEYLQRLDDGRYQIGPAPFLLGALYQRSLRIGDIVLPLMAKLAQHTGESASFYVIHGNARICMHRIDSKHEIRDHVREGDAFPLSQGSGGGVLSAFSGMRGGRYEQIRADYVYISRGERDSETAGISAPVFGSGQRLLGSLTISGPRSRIGDKLDKACLPLLKAAAHATRALGGDPGPLEQAAASTDTPQVPLRRRSAA